MMSAQQQALNNPFTLFEVSDKKSTEGIILEYDSYSITVKSTEGNKLFQTRFQRFLRKYKIQVLSDELMSEQQRRELAEIYFDTIVLGWDGNVTNREGEPLDFSKENFVWLMAALPKQFADIRDASGNWTLFREHSDTAAIAEN